MTFKLESVKPDAYAWFKDQLSKAPHCSVRVATAGRRKFEFFRNGGVFRLPPNAGIYVVYALSDQDCEPPIYAGESSNLRQRVEYHFSESATAKKNSTLKKTLKKNGLSADKPTHELIRFKYVEVPFGRKEIELMVHDEHGINTKDKGDSGAAPNP